MKKLRITISAFYNIKNAILDIVAYLPNHILHK
jgi:hypothetical protein